MEEIRVIGGENYPDISKYPKEDDLWNANISNISHLDHVVIASCVSSALDILQSYPVIIVYPDTTRQDVIDDWGKIKEYRTELNSIQGVFSTAGGSLKQTVYRLHNEFKMSYQEIARFLNFEMLVFLCAGLGLSEEYGSTSNEYLIEIFERFLLSYGYTLIDAKRIFRNAKYAMEEGKLPWNLDTGPFDSRKIREAVREFSKLVDDENFIIDRKVDNLPLFFIYTNSRTHIENKFRKQYKVGTKEEKLFQKWNRLIILILKDFLKHQEAFFPKLPMG
jgi:hypothetical protein